MNRDIVTSAAAVTVGVFVAGAFYNGIETVDVVMAGLAGLMALGLSSLRRVRR